MKYTYKDRYEAHLGVKGDGRQTCIIPDQVAADQKAYDGKTFPAIFLPAWQHLPERKIRVRLNGDDYGLYTSGTGDVIVRRA